MVSSYLFVHVRSIHVTDLLLLMHITIGWSIFCFSHRVHNRQQTELECESHRSNGVLPPAKCRNAQSDLSANLLHLPTGCHPFVSTPAFPRLQPTTICRACECFLVHGPHLQPLSRSPRNTHPTMGPGLHERLPTVRRPPEECPASAILE